jgi:hypothetical protein
MALLFVSPAKLTPHVYVPALDGVQDAEKLASPLLSEPLPLTTATPLQAVGATPLYRAKATVSEDPKPDPPLSVAVSPTLIATPTIPELGLATVAIVGLALLIVTVSPLPPQAE